jgi:hypothetical protein
MLYREIIAFCSEIHTKHREIIAVCSEIHRKHINTLCGQDVELLNVKLCGGTKITTGLCRFHNIRIIEWILWNSSEYQTNRGSATFVRVIYFFKLYGSLGIVTRMRAVGCGVRYREGVRDFSPVQTGQTALAPPSTLLNVYVFFSHGGYVSGAWSYPLTSM